VTATWTVVGEAVTDGYKELSIKLANTGDTNPLTDCDVQYYIGPTDADWVSETWTAGASLAGEASVRQVITGNAEVKMRVRAKSTIGTTTYCRIDGNR
jgi:hypothetical protein